MTILAILTAIGAIITGFFFRRGGIYNPSMPSLDRVPDDVPFIPASIPPVQAPTSPKVESITESSPVLTLLWNTPKNAFHSTRVMCDEMGLTTEQKNIVCACIFQESEFNNNAVGRNKDLVTGKIWSTDWGLVQVNDTKGWHIGKGLRFSSVQDVLDNPEKAVVWMISVMKETGRLQPWSSYTTKAYTQYLPKSSRMWRLKV